jgi:hypothetical protein
MALDLLLGYVARHPDELPKVLHILIEEFGFKPNDYLYKFAIQHNVVNTLWKRASEENGLAAHVFLAVAEPYLHTRFTTMHSTSMTAVKITKFELPSTPEIAAIRKCLWNGVFFLYKDTAFQERSLGVLCHYVRSAYELSVREIMITDASEILQFVESELNANLYSHCIVVQDYLKFLVEHEVPFDNTLRDRYQNDTYRIAEVLTEDYGSQIDKVDNYESFRKLKRKHIGEAFASYTFTDYRRLIEQCQEIKEKGHRVRSSYSLHDSLTMAFLELSERDDQLYVRVLSHYMEINDPLEVQPFFLVKELVKLRGPKTAYDLICKSGCTRQHWLSSFFECLEPNQVTEEWVEGVCALYQKTTLSALPYGMDFLLNYLNVDENIFARITGVILDRKEKEPDCVNALSLLFNPHSDANMNLESLFRDNLDILKLAYIASDTRDTHCDHDGSTFARIIDQDCDFLIQYVDARYEGDKHPSRYDDTRDYTFLWNRADYVDIATKLIDRVYELERKSFLHTYLEAFFRVNDSDSTRDFVKKRQDEVLTALIQRSNNDFEFMRFIFALIAEFSSTRRIPLIASFLECDNKYEAFKRLPLEPSSWSWSGSAVPMLQGRVAFLESLIPLLDGVDFLKHRQRVEEHIQGLNSQIESEKKRDFTEGEFGGRLT